MNIQEPIIREAAVADIPQIQMVRNAVQENRLSDPALVSDDDCVTFITKKGKGWVCECNNQLVGFSIVDVRGHNVWALFILPAHEKQGIGRQLHDIMLDWYFAQTQHSIWLSTAPGTRAAHFYTRAGWIENGLYGKGEIKFEMTYRNWLNQKINAT